MTLLLEIWIGSALLLAGSMSLYLALSAVVGASARGNDGTIRFRPESVVFRHHRIAASIAAASASFYLARMRACELLWPDGSLGAWSPILRVAAVVMALVLPLAATIFVRPSLLRPAEARLNRWFGPPERPAPRWLRLAAGLYCVPALGWVLVERLN